MILDDPCILSLPMTSASHDSRPPERAPAVTAEGESFASDPKRLRYAEVAIPAPGKSVEIAPGVRWARIPLPMDLNHINVWLIDAHDGCIVVDTGMAASMGKDAWESIAADVFATQAAPGRVRHSYSSRSHRTRRLAAGATSAFR